MIRSLGNYGGLLREAGLDWLFVAKTLLAMFITVWLAMRMGLQRPATAMMTVALLSHPQSGMVLAKGFYRALGTLVGCLAAVVLVSLFPQQRALLLVGMALWVGLCAGGAAFYRNFMSYGFVLSGYTVGIVVLPVIDQPQLLFQSVVMRGSEVLLGIVVVGIVSDVLFPQRLGMALRQSVASQFSGFVEFVRGSLGGVLARGDLEKAHLRFVTDSVQLENLRASVVFEDSGVRVHSPRLRRLNQDFMAVSTSYQSLHHLMNRLQGEARRPVRERVMALCGVLAEAIGEHAGSNPADVDALAARLAAARPRLAADSARGCDQLRGADRATRLDFATGAELVTRVAEELHDYAAALAVLASPGRKPLLQRHQHVDFEPGNDRLGALLAGLRVVTVMLAMAAFWLATAWPHGATAMLLTAIFSGLFASAPNPGAMVRNITLGFAIGMSLAFVCLFFVLSRMDGFALMVSGVVPFLLPGLYLMARPWRPGLGMGWVLGFVYILNLNNGMTFDPVFFVNEALSQMAGVLVVGVMFSLFGNASASLWLRQRLLQRLRDQVARAGQAPLPGLKARFESASRDLLMQMVMHAGGGDRRLLGWALAVHETGRALIDVRERLADQARPYPAVMAAVTALARLYQAPDDTRYRQAVACLSTALDDSPAALLAPLHLLRLALLDDDSVLADYRAATPQTLSEVPLAP
ncbi:MAG: FUSC family protein [Alcanivorax sp.]|nr:FUSC family protein [Alcanivorax sp.]